MAYDAPDDWPDMKCIRIMSGGMTVAVKAETMMREDAFRKKAARHLLSGIVTPYLLAKLTD